MRNAPIATQAANNFSSLTAPMVTLYVGYSAASDLVMVSTQLALSGLTISEVFQFS